MAEITDVRNKIDNLTEEVLKLNYLIDQQDEKVSELEERLIKEKAELLEMRKIRQITLIEIIEHRKNEVKKVN